MRKKILFVVTSHGELGNTGKPTGYFLSEVTHPWEELGGEYEIDVVSPKGGKPPVDGFDLTDPINKKYWDDASWRKKMENTMKPEDVRSADYCAIFYAGGHGAMWDYPDNRELAKIAAEIWNNGGVVASVCHGPAGLLNITLPDGNNLIKGKKLDSFTNAEEEANGTAKVVPFSLQDALEARGCVYDSAGLWADHVVIDGRLVTGQNPMSAKDVGRSVKKVLASLK